MSLLPHGAQGYLLYGSKKCTNNINHWSMHRTPWLKLFNDHVHGWLYIYDAKSVEMFIPITSYIILRVLHTPSSVHLALTNGCNR